jgi:hypothetical protein
MWWILQIGGAIGVVVAQIINRKVGFGIQSWIPYFLIATLVTYPTFGKSFAIAPSFIGAWFVGQTALNIVGLLAGLLYFHDAISTMQWVGITISVIGGYFIIFG